MNYRHLLIFISFIFLTIYPVGVRQTNALCVRKKAMEGRVKCKILSRIFYWTVGTAKISCIRVCARVCVLCIGHMQHWPFDVVDVGSWKREKNPVFGFYCFFWCFCFLFSMFLSASIKLKWIQDSFHVTSFSIFKWRWKRCCSRRTFRNFNIRSKLQPYNFGAFGMWFGHMNLKVWL